MKSNLTYIGLIFLLVVVIAFGTLYSIDTMNMEEGKPVVFSTWGRNYSHADEKESEEIHNAINEYIVKLQENNSHRWNEKWFSAERIYLISKEENVYYTYAWVYTASYSKKTDGELLEGNVFSAPYRFILAYRDGEFVVDKAESPRDGDQYAEDMESLFPEKVLAGMNKVHSDGTIEELQLSIQQQVADFYN